jgi:hypothetical protein
MRRLALAAGGAAVLYLAAGMAMSAIAQPPAWAVERVGPGEVVDAVALWAAGCARSRSASPDNCPQRGSDPLSIRSTAYVWSPARPLVLHVGAEWLAGLGAFEVRGTVNLDVRHTRVLADGRTQACGGNFKAPFVALARRVADDRGMDAYRWTGGSRAGGFAIRYVGPWWAWQCPPGPPGGRGDEEDPAR